MSNSIPNNKIGLMLGTLTVGILISGVIFFSIFHRPIDKIEDLREDIKIIKIILIMIASGAVLWIGKIILILI